MSLTTQSLLDEIFNAEALERDPDILDRVKKMIPIPDNCDATTHRHVAMGRIKTLYDGNIILPESAEYMLRKLTIMTDADLKDVI